ncbi:hypothetical protein L204_102105 [Cryptococcus depauperatus]|nr:SIT4-associating protein/190 [Cryptococcus depauperatus CBS 7855]
MFWRLNLAATSTLDSLLTREVPPTLEELMDEPDILTECKAQNNKLIAFLSREDSAKSLLQWVVAGLDELNQAAAAADTEIISLAISSPDLYPSYRVSAPLIIPGTGPDSPPALLPATLVEELGATESNGDLDVSALGLGLKKDVDEELHRSKYPATATEVLTCNEIWLIADTIIRNADTLLTPFWDAVLPSMEPMTPTTEGPSSLASSTVLSQQEASERERARNEFWSEKDEERDRKIEIIRALWMRVNSSLLMKRGPEMFRFIRSLPNIVERIVSHISSPAIQSLLIAIISSEEGGLVGVIDWLASEGLIPQLLNLLSPQYSPAIHTIVSDLIKQIISLCAPSPFNPHGGNAEQQAGSGQGGRDNRLIRDLVSKNSVEVMIGFMLDEVELTDEDWKGLNSDDDIKSPADPFIVHSLPSIASATSSLISVCVILVEIIRRNNSDFSEPHLFHTLRNRLISVRMHEDQDSREKELENNDKETEQEKEEKERRHMEEALVDMSSRMGIVHLGHLLSLISEKFERLHHFMLHPRSQNRVASIGNPKPFTLERFHILELYAELLHSSNMSILNRLPGTGPTYTGDGILSGGLEGLEALGEAIEDNDNEINDENSLRQDGVTRAKELPVSESRGGSLAGSDDVESEDEDVLEAINDDTTPLSSPGASSFLETPFSVITEPKVLPPPQEVVERLRNVMEIDPKPAASSATSGISSSSHLAVATSTVAPSDTFELSESERSISEPMENDTPEAPHIAKPLPPSTFSDPIIAPGVTLKQQYIAQHVLPSLVSFFFEYSENNFMHHVVFDILQQILNGKLGPGVNRELVTQTFNKGRLVEKILDAQRLNDHMVTQLKQPRLPHMGHIMLIAEEIVKFFSRCPLDLYETIKESFIESEWEAFVNVSLREARDKDERPLGGGKPIPLSPMRAMQDSQSDDDDNDEGTIDFGEPLTRTAANHGLASRGEFDAYADHAENGDGEDDEEAMDRYWKSSGIGLGGRRMIDSSDEDDDDADWLQPRANSWSSTGDEDDFGAWETGETQPANNAGFDDDAWA